MVSLWPWKGNDDSAAGFEKALSTLATKITKSQVQLDSLRQSSRRRKALWTLYTSLAYMLCAIVLVLVVGFKNWDKWEYTGMAGSPVMIYLVRTAIVSYYGYRINNVTSRLEEQQTERAKTIEKLKAATKYDSTQQLLEKYGGASPSPKPKASPSGTQKSTPKKNENTAVPPQRTNRGPPPTANIPRQITQAATSSQPGTPVPRMPILSPYAGTPGRQELEPQAEFAPNAYPAAPPQYSRSDSSYSVNASGGQWYDRIMDLLLGDDETSPKNRIVLICKNCRLVNGQAPPGVKNLADVGKWRCAHCGGWNGEVDEGKKLVQEIKEQMGSEGLPEMTEKKTEDVVAEKAGSANAGEVEAIDEESSSEELEEPEKPKAKRGRPKKSQ